MDTRCGNCRHKGYENNPNQAFCTCKDAKEAGWEWHEYRSKKTSAVADKIDKTNMSPSCMMVQSGYAELYSKTCPYKEELNNE